MIDGGLIVALIRASGSLIGAILALVFNPPKTRRDFIIRGSFSFLSGFVFGEPAREQYLHWPDRWEYWIASCALVALVSWASYGALKKAVLRAIDTLWKPKSDGDA